MKDAFARVSYTEAVEIVKQVQSRAISCNLVQSRAISCNLEPRLPPSRPQVPGPKDGVAWEFPPQWGEELQTEHEKYLAEVVYKKPVIVYNYPKRCKAFYMRLNDDDATVGAMDVLFPRVGEMVGGAARYCTRLLEIARDCTCSSRAWARWWEAHSSSSSSSGNDSSNSSSSSSSSSNSGSRSSGSGSSSARRGFDGAADGVSSHATAVNRLAARGAARCPPGADEGDGVSGYGHLSLISRNLA